MSRAGPPHYSSKFYEQQQEGSLRSARRVLPFLLDLTDPKSIVDVGCGVGTWLAAARELGVRDVLGLDGPYVDTTMLQIPPDCFRAADLTQPLDAGRTFDVALCLEVAEHLPESNANTLVESLTHLAPLVLFSAAVPRQCGEHHVNEQWQSWWVERFQQVGYIAVDCIRRRIWDDGQVEWWYAQNSLLMVRGDHLQTSPRLVQEHQRSSGPVNIVHPQGYLDRLNGIESLHPRGFREWAAAGPSLTAASLRRFLSRR
jgi:SAM-dependent methyltransferase